MELEYRVIPAPKRLKKIKGISSTQELFAATLTEAINAEARNGWEYVRAESLVAQEPRGFFRKGALVEETMLIFRRPRGAGPRLTAADAPVERHPEAAGEAPAPNGAAPRAEEPGAAARPAPAAQRPTAAPRPPQSERERRPEPQIGPPRPAGEAAAPPLLRPVPRFRPSEKT